MEREKLIWIALVALEELIHQATDAPVAPSFTIRVTLATLYAFSDGHRAHFDDFWKQMQATNETQFSEDMASYCRTAGMGRNLRGIIRAVGMPETPEFHNRLGDAARTALVGQPSK